MAEARREGLAAARGPRAASSAPAASANPGLDHERHGREGGGATDGRLRPGRELPLRLLLYAAGRRLLLLYAAGRRLAEVALRRSWKLRRSGLALSKHPEDYDKETFTRNEMEYIEMDLILGVADLRSEQAVDALKLRLTAVHALDLL